MQYLIGFVIATFIALTGVGAGTITTPVLILFLHVPAAMAVTLGLTFSAAVKLALVPAQIWRKHIAWRTLGYMLLGGLPGVLIGSLLLGHLIAKSSQIFVDGALGLILISTASWQIAFSFRPMPGGKERPDRSRILPWLMLPVGAEVGFSSAGAGALGSAALLTFTALAPAQVVGTDIAFGLLTSLTGSSIHWSRNGINPVLLAHLVEGGLIGAIAGTLLAGKIPRRPLRFALWIWLLLIGGRFVFETIHRLG